MAEGWGFINQNAWIPPALLAVAFVGAAATMRWHMAESQSGRYSWLVVVALLVMSLSFVLAGVSVGERPIVNGRQLIPTIRLLWLVAGVLLNVFIVAYWAQRVKVKRYEWKRGTDELPEAGD